VPTVLNLLTSDGAVQVAFTTELTAKQYDLLLEVVEEASSPQQLREFLQEWASGQGLAVSFNR
jgi:hypothetical protein